MDFYVDLALAVLLRLLKDRRAIKNYREALAKVHRAIEAAALADEPLRNMIHPEVG